MISEDYFDDVQEEATEASEPALEELHDEMVSRLASLREEWVELVEERSELLGKQNRIERAYQALEEGDPGWVALRNSLKEHDKNIREIEEELEEIEFELNVAVERASIYSEELY